MTSALAAVLALGILLPGDAAAEGGRELSDAELDRVVAGVVDPAVEEDLLRFHYVGAAGRHHEAEIDGSVSLTRRPVGDGSRAFLIVDRGAQAQLRSLISVNAVNSDISILLNLNVNVHSTVGELHQSNLRVSVGSP